LYVTSGHYAKYGADSFQPISTPAGEEFIKTNELPASQKFTTYVLGHGFTKALCWI
jgi:hypothetical protein